MMTKAILLLVVCVIILLVAQAACLPTTPSPTEDLESFLPLFRSRRRRGLLSVSPATDMDTAAADSAAGEDMFFFRVNSARNDENDVAEEGYLPVFHENECNAYVNPPQRCW